MISKHKRALQEWASILDNTVTGFLIQIIKRDFELTQSKTALDHYLSTYEEDFGIVPARRVLWYLEKQLVHLFKHKKLPITPDLRIFELTFEDDIHLVIRTLQTDSSIVKVIKFARPIIVDEFIRELNEYLDPLMLKAEKPSHFNSPVKNIEYRVVITTDAARLLRKQNKFVID